MMSTEEVAMRLVELCKGTEWKKAVDELYANDTVSVEPHTVGNVPAEVNGIDRVRGRNDWREKHREVRDPKVRGSSAAGETLVVTLDVDVSTKVMPVRIKT